MLGRCCQENRLLVLIDDGYFDFQPVLLDAWPIPKGLSGAKWNRNVAEILCPYRQVRLQKKFTLWSWRVAEQNVVV